MQKIMHEHSGYLSFAPTHPYIKHLPVLPPRLVLILLGPLPRQHGKNKITRVRLQLGLGAMHQPPLLVEGARLGVPLRLIQAVVLARRQSLPGDLDLGQIHARSRSLPRLPLGTVAALPPLLPRLGPPHNLLLLLLLQAVEHGRPALDVAQPLHGFLHGRGGGVAAAQPFLGEPDALAAHFQPLGLDLDHVDFEPAEGAQGGDGFGDLLDAGREGADADGFAGVEGRDEGFRGVLGGGFGGRGRGRDIGVGGGLDGGGRGRGAREVLERLPGRGQVEEDGVGLRAGAVVEVEAVAIDIAMGHGHHGVEAVLDDLVPELRCARLVVFKRVDAAVSRCALALRGLRADSVGVQLFCQVGGCIRCDLHPRRAIVDATHGGVGEGAAACAGFDEVVARADAQALQDVAVVGGVDDLGSVGERQRPCLWRRRNQVREAAACGCSFYDILLRLGRIARGGCGCGCFCARARALLIFAVSFALLRFPTRARVDN
ncbi:hypothetical protein B5807_08893 [Epicoccum nigrum]|uniref:Uncharacterized protein n=1 Tax=Epicoccum nigrum TaxID=105696 RepID=A0A1Y2LVC0_EPING|nr:hypothetical protein B5807_08893 [Epicoccum nigrum]